MSWLTVAVKPPRAVALLRAAMLVALPLVALVVLAGCDVHIQGVDGRKLFDLKSSNRPAQPLDPSSSAMPKVAPSPSESLRSPATESSDVIIRGS